MPSKIRIAMLGGGEGSMIGPVHRAAMRITDRYDLVAGVFSSDHASSLKLAATLGIPEENVYKDYAELLHDASKLKLDAVAITTPNHLHVAAAQAFADHGIHIICEKPLGSSFEGVRSLRDSIDRNNVVFALTHPYSAYPVVRRAQELVASGELGNVRSVAVEYIQGWLASVDDPASHKGASWRNDPRRGGAGGALGDIGTHAFQLAEFVSGLQVASLLSETSSSPGRPVPDDARLLLRFSNGATGSLWCSQVAVGAQNGLRLRVFGDKKSLAWSHDFPERLHVFDADCNETVLHKGPSKAAMLPIGHPEGYFEGFATLYNEFADEVLLRKEPGSKTSSDSSLPGINTGIRGMSFIDATLESSAKGSVWTSIDQR